ncbi:MULTISPECIES: nucleotidyltransferase family protein [Pseudofrankia]|uniref:nucleotidyltransferase family protein n=1 Tax=Pseudofrankia TaxID=2994363 RepID=UPI0022B7D855|nr:MULTISPECIES: NTP transferase domain-containing protein [Pseudofrankia]
MAGLLLAAGAGRRLGMPKGLLTWAGTPLVVRGARLLTAGGCSPLAVTVGAAAEEVAAALAGAGATDGGPPAVAPARVVRVDDWAEGMGASLRAGLAAFTADHVDAVVVALVDQPLVSPALIRRLIGAANTAAEGTDAEGAGERPRPAAIVAGYAGRPRTPVLLRREVWPDVAQLARGDVGARAWLRANPDRVLQVPCEDVGSPDDIDTAADLTRLTADTRLQLERREGPG